MKTIKKNWDDAKVARRIDDSLSRFDDGELFVEETFSENVTFDDNKVKSASYDNEKGFGFIAPDGGDKDVFVHISAVERSGLSGLADNQKVNFDVEAGRDGRESAVNITAV